MMQFSDFSLILLYLIGVQEIKCYEGYSNATPAEDTEVQGHGMRVFALKHSPDNSHILLSGGWDNHIKVSLVLHYVLTLV